MRMKTSNKHPDTGNSDQEASEPPILTLNGHGAIVDCSGGNEAFFGYTRNELASMHVSDVLPEFGEWELLPDGAPNPRLRFLCRINHAFLVKGRGGVCFLCGLTIVYLNGHGQEILRVITHPIPGYPI
jgi:hypothetical protein